MSGAERRTLKELVSGRVRALIRAGSPNPLVRAADYRPWRIGSWDQAAGRFRRKRPSWSSAQLDYEGAGAPV